MDARSYAAGSLRGSIFGSGSLGSLGSGAVGSLGFDITDPESWVPSSDGGDSGDATTSTESDGGGVATPAQATVLCTMTGGSGTNDNCACPSGYSWDPNSGCVNSAGKAGGFIGGKGFPTKTGGAVAVKPKPATTTPAQPVQKASLFSNPLVLAGGLVLLGAAAIGYSKYKRTHG